MTETIICQFQTIDNEKTGPELEIPKNITISQLQILINELLKNEEEIPYSFYVNDTEITDTLLKTMEEQKTSTEQVLTIIYQPQAIFRVRAVSRCTSSLAGHTEAILNVNFSPNGKQLASGSGDSTVRLWDLNTETPKKTLEGHSNWVLYVSFSPDGKKLASGGMSGDIIIWSVETGEKIGKTLTGHSKWITCLSWEPFHCDPTCRRLVSSSKDGTSRVWDTVNSTCDLLLSGHTKSVTCVKWGGEGFIYTSSQDCTIKVWSAKDGRLVRSLEGHGHWVNTMALNTDYIIRTGPFDHKTFQVDSLSEEESKKLAIEKYQSTKGNRTEKLVTGSDDFTLILWDPTVNNKQVARMTGHRQLINQVCFSPDMRIIASASFDKSIKLWDGNKGDFIGTLFGHVGAVYQISFSSDSRLLVSGSKDSTAKVWDIKSKKLLNDLPGHSDEVYSVDWSPDGQRVATGGKDRILKIWRF